MHPDTSGATSVQSKRRRPPLWASLMLFTALVLPVPILACGGGSISVVQSKSGSGSGSPTATQPPVPTATQTHRTGYVTVPLLSDNTQIKLADGTQGVERLTVDSPNWTQAIPAPTANADAPVTGLQLVIETGGDNLGDGGSVIIHYATVGDVKYTVNLFSFDNYTTRTFVLMPIPNATTLGDVQSITIEPDLAGSAFGSTGDNWDIYSMTLSATFLQ